MTQEPEDKALLKIVNHNNQTFYLESASCNLKNEEDMRAPGQQSPGLINLTENMYLVVRSLKLNNEKVVSFWLQSNVYRTMKYKRRTSSRLAESSSLSRRSATSRTLVRWKLTTSRRMRSVTLQTQFSTNPMMPSLKSSKKSKRLSCTRTKTMKKTIGNAASAGRRLLTLRTLYLSAVNVRDPWVAST